MQVLEACVVAEPRRDERRARQRSRPEQEPIAVSCRKFDLVRKVPTDASRRESRAAREARGHHSKTYRAESETYEARVRPAEGPRRRGRTVTIAVDDRADPAEATRATTADAASGAGSGSPKTARNVDPSARRQLSAGRNVAPPRIRPETSSVPRRTERATSPSFGTSSVTSAEPETKKNQRIHRMLVLLPRYTKVVDPSGQIRWFASFLTQYLYLYWDPRTIQRKTHLHHCRYGGEFGLHGGDGRHGGGRGPIGPRLWWRQRPDRPTLIGSVQIR